jgi:hypothetical protein
MDSPRPNPAFKWMPCNLAEPRVDTTSQAIPKVREQGVFWSEPAMQSGLCMRTVFDNEGKIFSVISVFDHSPP